MRDWHAVKCSINVRNLFSSGNWGLARLSNFSKLHSYVSDGVGILAYHLEHRVNSHHLLCRIETGMTGLWCGYGDELGFRIEDINVGWGREVQEAIGHESGPQEGSWPEESLFPKSSQSLCKFTVISGVLPNCQVSGRWCLIKLFDHDNCKFFKWF